MASEYMLRTLNILYQSNCCHTNNTSNLTPTLSNTKKPHRISNIQRNVHAQIAVPGTHAWYQRLLIPRPRSLHTADNMPTTMLADAPQTGSKQAVSKLWRSQHKTAKNNIQKNVCCTQCHANAKQNGPSHSCCTTTVSRQLPINMKHSCQHAHMERSAACSAITVQAHGQQND